jgi:hypothetical protein
MSANKLVWDILIHLKIFDMTIHIETIINGHNLLLFLCKKVRKQKGHIYIDIDILYLPIEKTDKINPITNKNILFSINEDKKFDIIFKKYIFNLK